MIGFWIFMLITALLIPAMMIFFGRRFRNAAPKTISQTFGYRTARSMINQDTWTFAHQLLGKIWLISGIALFVLSFALMLFLLGDSIDELARSSVYIVLAQVAVMLLTIIPVEAALRRKFDVNGNRKERNKA